MATNTPRPSGTIATEKTLQDYLNMTQDWFVTQWDAILEFVGPDFINAATIAWLSTKAFVTEYAAVFGILFVLWGVSWLILRRVRRWKRSIQKLWLYSLFFLSKRLMMIPLVYTVAKREGVLAEDKLDMLLELRHQAKNISLKRSPRQRMLVEEQISKILYGYFMQLDSAGELEKHPAMMKMVDDFQFIDGKLVQLQEIYNEEIVRWNKKVARGFWNFLLFRWAGHRSFEPFGQ